jgi:hypothetical protein
MKKILLFVLLTLALVIGTYAPQGIAQASSPEIGVGLTLHHSDGTPSHSFALGEDIIVRLSLENNGTQDVIAPVWFTHMKFHLLLDFTSSDGEHFTSSYLTEIEDFDFMPPPKVMTIDGVQTPVEPVEVLAGTASPPAWYWKINDFNALDFYPLKCRTYSVKALFPIRSHPPEEVIDVYGRTYAPIDDSDWTGFIVSSTWTFTISTEFCTGTVKPKAITMEYTGRGCEATNDSQLGDTCEDFLGGPSGLSPVYIIALNRHSLDHPQVITWFDSKVDGAVDVNSTFVIDAKSYGHLNGQTYVFIYQCAGGDCSEAGDLLQKVVFHTSCSEPLNCGDRFGALELLDFTPE